MTRATIATEIGDIEIELYDESAPKAAKNFIDLAKKGFYDDVVFHRVGQAAVVDLLPDGAGVLARDGLPRTVVRRVGGTRRVDRLGAGGGADHRRPGGPRLLSGIQNVLAQLDLHHRSRHRPTLFRHLAVYAATRARRAAARAPASSRGRPRSRPTYTTWSSTRTT